MAKLSPIGNNAQFINGIPASGAKLFTYAAGSSTKQTTYSDEAGLIPQTNPIILDSRGEPSQPIWLTEGLSYKFVFTASTDSDPPVSPIWDVDDVTGINDSSVSVSQWIDSGVTPTYVSATQFTLPGDQTTAFEVNRRIKATVTAGTVYGYISASVFGALTTVTVVLDSGTLDSGLSAVQLGLITATNTSLPKINNFVTTAMITDGSVTPPKLSTGAPGWDANGVYAGGTAALDLSPAATGQYPIIGSYITSQIIASAATKYSVDAGAPLYVFAKSRGASLGAKTIVQSSDGLGTIMFRGCDGVNYINSASITAFADGTPGVNDMPGRLSISTTPDGSNTLVERWRVSNDGSFSSVIPSGSTLYPEFKCRAWVNFNGTGVVAIRASGNVTSITDNGVGDYTVNLTTAMPDANGSISGMCSVSVAGAPSTQLSICGYIVNTSSFRLAAFNSNSAVAQDPASFTAQLFR